MNSLLSGGCSKKRIVKFLATPGTFSEFSMSCRFVSLLGVTPVLVDRGVNRTSPLATDVNE